VATNPPYGIRVGQAETVRNLYAQFGNVMRKKMPGWRVAMYLPNRWLTKDIGLQFNELLRTTNGGIKIAGAVATVSSSTIRL
jgi:putative N6-adenine-specific DNA methylase